MSKFLEYEIYLTKSDYLIYLGEDEDFSEDEINNWMRHGSMNLDFLVNENNEIKKRFTWAISLVDEDDSFDDFFNVSFLSGEKGTAKFNLLITLWD